MQTLKQSESAIQSEKKIVRVRTLPPNDEQLLEQCALFDVHRFGRVLNSLYNDHLRGSGLTISQYTLLRNIAALSSASITQIAKVMQMERTSVTRLIEPLISRKLVETVPGEDRRFRYVIATTAGRAAVRNSDGAWQAAQQELMSRIGVAQWRSLRVALREAMDLMKDCEVNEREE